MKWISSHVSIWSLSTLVAVMLALVVFLIVSGTPRISAQVPDQNIVSYYEGDEIELTLPGIKSPDSCSGDRIRTVDVRTKVSDSLGLYFEGIEATYDLDPVKSIGHDIKLPAVDLEAGDYRATYYVKRPICIELQDHPDDTGMSLMAKIPETVYWAAGDINYDSLVKRRESCCTGWQILFIVIGGGIALVCAVAVMGQNPSCGSFLGGVLVGAITGVIVIVPMLWILPGPLKYDPHTKWVDWSQNIVIDDGATVGQILFPEGFDVEKQFKGLASVAYGYTLAGETTFKVVSTLVDDIEVPRTLLTEGESAEITAILVNRDETDISAEVSLICNNGYSETGTAKVSAGAFGKIIFTDIVLPAGEHVCSLHGKSVELTVVPRPFLAFHGTRYSGDLGEIISVTGDTNLEDGVRIALSIGKQISGQEYRESYSATGTAEGGYFEFSIPTGGLPEGDLQISVSSSDQMISSSVDLVLVKHFTQISVESIIIPRGPLISGERLHGLASIRNTGNADWGGSIEILSGGINAGAVSGTVISGELKDLPFEIVLGRAGKRMLQIGGRELPISVMGVPWIKMSADDTVDLGESVVVWVSTNLTEGQIRTKISKQSDARSIAVASEIISITGNASYPVALNANEPGIYLIESSSLLDLGSYAVQDAISVQVVEAEGNLIYRLRVDPADTIVVGTESEIYVEVENGTNSGIVAPLEVLVNGVLYQKDPTDVKAGEIISRTIPLAFDILNEGYNIVEIDQRVQQIHVLPMATSSGSDLASTEEFTFSIHATDTNVVSGTEVLVTASATNTTTNPIELRMVLALGPGLTTSGGTGCASVMCTWTDILHPGRNIAPVVSVHVRETSKVTLQYSYLQGNDWVRGELVLPVKAR